MEYVVQLSKRQNLTILQKLIIAVLFIAVSVRAVYRKTNSYFGIDGHVSDRIWFYGFYSFLLLMAVFCLSIISINS